MTLVSLPLISELVIDMSYSVEGRDVEAWPKRASKACLRECRYASGTVKGLVRGRTIATTASPREEGGLCRTTDAVW